MNYQEGLTFVEGNLYKLQHDYYESLKLECTYIEDNTIWFVANRLSVAFNISPSYYKLNRKTNKLYRLNEVYSSWDSIENTLSEYSAGDAWSKRQAYTAYDNMNQGD